ncbi:hypothetical protein KCU91_g15090, partial [Aureobasidium melanogenum]
MASIAEKQLQSLLDGFDALRLEYQRVYSRCAVLEAQLVTAKSQHVTDPSYPLGSQPSPTTCRHLLIRTNSIRALPPSVLKRPSPSISQLLQHSLWLLISRA